MTTLPPDYTLLLERITTWAHAQSAVRAVVLIGSYARADGTADADSDLDLLLIVTDVEPFRTDSTWLTQFGHLWAQYCDVLTDGNPEWYGLYRGDLKVDFAFAPAAPECSTLAVQLQRIGHHTTLARGLRVLVDKFPATAPLTLEPPLPAPPSALDLQQLHGAFWISALRVEKFTRRGDLWRAHSSLHTLRGHLLRLLEWSAQAEHGRNYDTWYSGRFLSTWLDAPTYQTLLTSFVPATAADLLAARQALVQVFIVRLAQVCTHYHYPALPAQG